MDSRKLAIRIELEVFEAAERILDPKISAYPGMAMTGNKESYERFAKDVMLLAETIAEIACGLKSIQ
jgi:hypothetical protein